MSHLQSEQARVYPFFHGLYLELVYYTLHSGKFYYGVIQTNMVEPDADSHEKEEEQASLQALSELCFVFITLKSTPVVITVGSFIFFCVKDFQMSYLLFFF